jgi:hypothetical protein
MPNYLVEIYGSHEAVVSWQLGTIVLPIVTNITDENPTEGEDFEVEGGDPVICTRSRSARTLTISGFIAEASHSKANLEADYLATLRSYRGTVQTLLDPRGIYTEDWLVRSIGFSEVAEGAFARFAFRVVLKRGSGFADNTQAPAGGY